MSVDITTNENLNESVELSNESRRLEMVIGTDQANAMLAAAGLPFPDAADLDEIRIKICGSKMH